MALSSLILFSACKDDETIEKDFKYDVTVDGVSSTEVQKGGTATFTDYSINVKSRVWTFEDATPATSGDAVVDVVFNSQGTKKATLTVTYKDGSKDEGTINMTVLNSLSAEISATGLTEKSCAKKGATIKFALDNVKGDPTSYSWTFPGGTPETSTDAAPSVVWNDQINSVDVTCVLTRAEDGVTTTVTKNIIAGNYPLFTEDAKKGIDIFGFEKGDGYKNWYAWGRLTGETVARDCAELFSVVDGGANGSSKSLKIDLSNVSILDNFNIMEIAHRNSWPDNATMEVGKKYELAFWMKADIIYAGCFWLQLFSYTPDWLNDPLRGLEAASNWKEYFGEDYVVSGMTKLYENAITTLGYDDSGNLVGTETLLTTDWKKYSWEFTLGEDGSLGANGTVMRNCYLAMGLSGAGQPVGVYLDELQLNLIEE